MTETIGGHGRAVADGGPLFEPHLHTIGAALVRAAGLHRPGEIGYLGDDGSFHNQSYAELLADAARILSGIRKAGPNPGDKIIIYIEHDPDLLATFWACILGGFVPVPVTTSPPPNSPLSAAGLLAGVWGMLDNAWVVTGAPMADDVPFVGASLGQVATLRDDLPASDFYAAQPDDLAALLLTSGSTGLPKAVMLTHRNIVSRSVATARVRHLTSANRTFNWMPLDHVGGLIMFHVRDVLLGCHQVHARIQWVLADPLRWLDAISEHMCDTTWAPNFAFGLIIDRAEEIACRSWDLSRLGYIMNGGESVKARVARRFLSILAPFGLPPTAMHPGWGMSETSAGVVDCVFSASTSTDEDRFVPVGVPHPGVLLRVVDADGHIVAGGAVGRLQVAGLPITSGYYGNAEQNRQSFTADGWFKTGDVAFISDGVLTVTGRADDVIEFGGVSYYGHEIEAAVEELSFVEPSYTVVCEIALDSGTDSGTIGGLAIFFHPRSGVSSDQENRQVRAKVETRFGVQVSHVAAVTKDQVPKTGIGKLKRSQLAQQMAAK